ncbi:probable G-protein coupled receptor 101 [Actinia tenebrosa]|uniref:Probable G-protein coupled receptor 101 n=1 Tax=Actinia tenebrosa TaxID=6105 RepID=A0A6P8IGJ2_ACTTE|nr:probable G-protein coupled receptor 101 [Actinia tenebrosa]
MSSSNSSLQYSASDDTVHCVSHTFKLVSTIAICFSGCFMNGSILLVLLRKPQRSIVNTILFHLALSDMVVFLANGPYLFLSYFDQKLAFSSLLCQVGAFIGRFTTAVSMHLLTVMSLSRFYSLLKPLEYRVRVTATKAKRVCIGAWVITFWQSLTPVLGWGKYTVIKGQCYCALDSSEHMSNWFAHLLLAFAIPLTLNAWIFARTLRLVNFKIRDAKKGRISGGPEKKETSLLNKGERECTSSVDNERNTGNVLPNKYASVNNRNLGNMDKGTRAFEEEGATNNPDDIKIKARINEHQYKSEEMAVVIQGFVAIVNEENKKEPDEFVNQSIEDEGATNNPDDIKIKARINEQQHKSDEMAVVIQDFVAMANEENKKKPDEFVNQSFEDEGATNNPDDIEITARVNEQKYESIEMPGVVIQGIEQEKQTELSTTDDKDHEISVSSVEKSSCHHENKRQLNRKQIQQEEGSNKMKKKQHNENKTCKLVELKKELKANVIISLLFTAYVIGCGPTYVVWTWFALDPKSVPRTAFLSFRFLAGIQSVINPFIYGFMNSEIRADVLALWKNARCVFRKQ